jgi:transcriptional regulator with XRE-family HTH domain
MVSQVLGGEIRDERDVSQEQLVLDAGLDRPFISLLERGVRSSKSTNRYFRESLNRRRRGLRRNCRRRYAG